MFAYICEALPCFQFMKKLNNWNSEKVYLVVCGCLLVICGCLLVFCGRLLVVCGGLWLFVLVTTQNKGPSNSQCYFRKDHRTTDQILILFSIIKKYFKSGIYKYTYFFDFQKVKDSVWREGLKFKLQNSGIRGKFFQIIDLITYFLP